MQETVEGAERTALGPSDVLDLPEWRRRESVARLDGLRERMAGRQIEAAYLNSRRTFAWLTVGGLNHVATATETGVAGLLVTRDAATVIAPTIEAERLREEEVLGLDLEVVAVDWWRPAGAAREAARLCGREPATDSSLEADLVELRSRLSPLDQHRMVQIGERATSAVCDALDRVVAGMTEADLAREVLCNLGGIRAPVVLVAADDRIARYRHPLPTDTPIRRRAMLVLVAERWGLHAAVTRFCELDPPGPDLERRFEAVAEVEAAMYEATRPGAKLGDVFEAARGAYARTGYADEWKLHHQGGTIGYQGRERIATPDDPTMIEAGMAFAWNPSITGVKTEDTFILGADGQRRIVTHRPAQARD
jgi:Xaa-Pro aminopeptidase